MAARYATAADLPGAFAGVAAHIVSEALAWARPHVSVAGLGEDTSEAHALLAAHWLNLNKHGTGPAAIPGANRTVGRIGIVAPFANQGNLPFSLRRTTWGQQYLDLTEGRGGVVMVT